ncbi:MAG: chemotaxis protein CheB [Desulfocapsaceae bacterium]|nr:chemotaxis protein CheB [Desulfocapsaceae bacterium]
MAKKSGKYQAVVIGVSAGGIAALEKILPVLPEDFGLALLVVQHISADGGNYLVEHFSASCALEVVEAADKERIQQGTVYFAPPNYHLLVERAKTTALTVDAKVNYARPSADVLFETAAEAYCDALIGIVLTGANNDGAAGLARIKQLGGLTIVQSPKSAEATVMPMAALKALTVDHVLDLEEIGPFLVTLATKREE